MYINIYIYNNKSSDPACPQETEFFTVVYCLVSVASVRSTPMLIIQCYYRAEL